MTTYAGLDVSLETVAVCVLDEAGRVVWRGKCAAEPEIIARLLAERAQGLVRTVLESGSLSGWLHRELKRRGMPVVCIDARHAKAVLMQRMNKTDAIDAQGLAELARVGWFRVVQPKSEPAQLVATLITSRANLIKMRADLVNQNPRPAQAVRAAPRQAAGPKAHAPHPRAGRRPGPCCRR